MFILSCCSLEFLHHYLKVSKLIQNTFASWRNANVIMFASPDIPLRASLCCSNEASIPVLNVQICPSCLSAFTWVLNSTHEKFVTIWRLLSSTKADVLGGYIIDVTPCAHWNYLPAYKQWLKNLDRVVFGAHLKNTNCHDWWHKKHQELDS